MTGLALKEDYEKLMKLAQQQPGLNELILLNQKYSHVLLQSNRLCGSMHSNDKSSTTSNSSL
jgi:hypothetical protein